MQELAIDAGSAMPVARVVIAAYRYRFFREACDQLMKPGSHGEIPTDDDMAPFLDKSERSEAALVHAVDQLPAEVRSAVFGCLPQMERDLFKALDDLPTIVHDALEGG